uniref:PIN domain-containing protein n=1 Tax=Candidatus Kentrum sp. FW TaxID=2126338 RepID=A0A450U076_9GAMM|nr:MAG: hypothetical protein BECKFW1821C_GA0114237_10865 [Candidatus Kentron sp. FW]
MTKRRAYIDANVWIVAVQGGGELLQRVCSVLQSNRRRLVISDFVLLGVLPKPLFHRYAKQWAALEKLFSLTEKLSPDYETLLPKAIRLLAIMTYRRWMRCMPPPHCKERSMNS